MIERDVAKTAKTKPIIVNVVAATGNLLNSYFVRIYYVRLPFRLY